MRIRTLIGKHHIPRKNEPTEMEQDNTEQFVAHLTANQMVAVNTRFEKPVEKLTIYWAKRCAKGESIPIRKNCPEQENPKI